MVPAFHAELAAQAVAVAVELALHVERGGNLVGDALELAGLHSRLVEVPQLIERDARFPLPHDLPVAVFERSRPLELASGEKLDWINMLRALLKVDIVGARQFYDAIPVVQPRERRTLLRRIRAEKLLDEAKRAKIDLDYRRH